MTEPFDPGPRDDPRAPRLPVARAVAVRRPSPAWLLPLLALAFAAFTAWRAWDERGPRIRVLVREGHGIEAGDALRYRGVQVGRIEELSLVPDLSGVELSLRLMPEAAGLAREGSRFWLVRPELSLEGVRGLETLLGANYMAVLPGPADAPAARSFVALEVPPLGEALEPGGLHLVLEAPARFSLAPGAPLTFRDFQVGTVLSVGLASDATAVEVAVHVRPAYRQLVRADSVFWETGGVEIDLALTQGLHVDIGSLRALLVGGIALATPTHPGPPVESGQRFRLHDGPREEWREWRPALPVGAASEVAGGPRPRLVPASIRYTPKRLLGRRKERAGWLLPVAGGVVGPSDLLQPGEPVRDGEVELEIAGRPWPAAPPEALPSGPLARRALALEGQDPWPAARVARDPRAGDWLVVGDPALPPLAVSAARLMREEEGWRVLDGAGLTAAWHGAAVLDRADGRLVGLLLAGPEGARVVPVPPAWIEPEESPGAAEPAPHPARAR